MLQSLVLLYSTSKSNEKPAMVKKKEKKVSDQRMKLMIFRIELGVCNISVLSPGKNDHYKFSIFTLTRLHIG